MWTHAPRGHWHHAPHAPHPPHLNTHLGPMALPTGNQQPDLKPLFLLKPWQKTPEQKNMKR